MKDLRRTIIINWYIERFSLLCEEVSTFILDSKSNAEMNILPKKKDITFFTSKFIQACIYLNKASMLNPIIDVDSYIETRNDIAKFIHY